LHPVTDYATYASPFHTVQMIGNVWELINERTNPSDRMVAGFAKLLTPAPTRDDPWYQMRGGGFREPLVPGMMWDSGSIPAQWKHDDLGFRCAKDAQ
jgi:formylglycine-generating enzyme required for sulfatase activity